MDRQERTLGRLSAYLFFSREYYVEQERRTILITFENWEEHKEYFFNEKIERYDKFLSKEEKINLEIEFCEELLTMRDDVRTKCLVQRYKELLKNKLNPKIKDYKTQNLFKVGLLFATGVMNKYFTLNNKNETVMKEGYSAPKIATELGNISFDKYILSTINNYPTSKANGNKNVFNSLKMMTNIIEHCKANNLAIDPYFISRLPIE